MPDDFLTVLQEAVELYRTQGPPDPEAPVYLDRAAHSVSIQMAEQMGVTVETLWAPHPVVLTYGEHVG